MKIILICLFFIISCSKEPTKEIIELSIKKSVKYDDQFWSLSHITIIDKVKNSSFDSEVSFCEDIKASFKLTLNKNCYLNNGSILENNIVISWIKRLVSVDAIKMKVFEQDVCINDEEIAKELNEDIEMLKKEVGTKKCLDLIQTGRCQLKKVITQDDVNDNISILRKQVEYSLNQMKLYKKGYSENLDTKFRLCKMKNDTWEFWEVL